MADQPTSAASALFPNLPSGAPAEARPAPPGGASVYGSPEGGITRARATMAGGIAQPAAGPSPSEPGKPAAEGGWLKAALTDQNAQERSDRDAVKADADRGPPAAAAAEPLDIEGLDIEGPLATQFSELAGEVGLTRAGAEKMVELHQAAVADVSTRFWQEQHETWEKQSRSQFGSRLDSMVSAVTPLLADNRLTTPGFRALLSQYGFGSNPDVIATLSRWAQEMRRGR